MTRRILPITGATGAQGGAALRELIRHQGDWDLRDLVRNPGADKAQALARQGVTLVKGNLDDEGSLRVALLGGHGVQTLWGTDPRARSGRASASPPWQPRRA